MRQAAPPLRSSRLASAPPVHRRRMGAGGFDGLQPGAQLRYMAEHEQTLAHSPIVKTSAYTGADARAAYEPARGNWSLALWAKNLADTRYVTAGFDIAGIHVADVYLNVPRTDGLDLRYRFW